MGDECIVSLSSDATATTTASGSSSNRCISLDADDGSVYLPRSGERFVCDSVFDESSTQEEVYEVAGKRSIEHVFNGFNTSILAYGQTGSGTCGVQYITTTTNENEIYCTKKMYLRSK